ncbi:MAG: c-type cytochrome [Akkermansiaceae bacterium]|nr:c-type cytochrome [Akkermansiaceae bacterium]
MLRYPNGNIRTWARESLAGAGQSRPRGRDPPIRARARFEGDAAKGARFFQPTCAVCHRLDAESARPGPIPPRSPTSSVRCRRGHPRIRIGRWRKNSSSTLSPLRGGAKLRRLLVAEESGDSPTLRLLDGTNAAFCAAIANNHWLPPGLCPRAFRRLRSDPAKLADLIAFLRSAR